MRITTYILNVEQRRYLIAKGIVKSSGGSTGIFDGINVKDLLREGVQFLKEDPDFDIQQALKERFSKSERYFLFEGRKILFGVEEVGIAEPFETDVTDLFFETIEEHIRANNQDLDEFKNNLNEKIYQTEEFKEAIEQLTLWDIKRN